MSFSREHSIRFVISELTWKHDKTVHLSLWSIWSWTIIIVLFFFNMVSAILINKPPWIWRSRWSQTVLYHFIIFAMAEFTGCNSSFFFWSYLYHFFKFQQEVATILIHHLKFENQDILLQNTIFFYQICKARLIAKLHFIYFSITRMILDKSLLMFYFITSYSLFSSHFGFKDQDLLRKLFILLSFDLWGEGQTVDLWWQNW